MSFESPTEPFFNVIAKADKAAIDRIIDMLASAVSPENRHNGPVMLQRNDIRILMNSIVIIMRQYKNLELENKDLRAQLKQRKEGDEDRRLDSSFESF